MQVIRRYKMASLVQLASIVFTLMIFFASAGFDLRTFLLGLVLIALLSFWLKVVKQDVRDRPMETKTRFSVENLLWTLPALPYWCFLLNKFIYYESSVSRCFFPAYSGRTRWTTRATAVTIFKSASDPWTSLFIRS